MTGSELKVVGKLVISQARLRPGRVALTALSTMAAACVVVWVVSGYDALVGRFGDMGEKYLGRYEFLVLPGGSIASDEDGPRPQPRLSKDLIDAIRRDPAVAVVDPAFETRVQIRSPTSPPPSRPPTPAMGPDAFKSGPVIMGGMAQLKGQARNPVLVGTDSTEPLHPVLQGHWFDPRRPDANEAAITQDSAEALGIKVGDEVVVPASGGSQGESRLKIVAVVEQPRRLPSPKFMVGLPPSRDAALRGGPAGNAVYVPMATALKLAGTPARISYAGVVLKPGNKVDEFLAVWSDRMAKASPPATARTVEDVGEEVDKSTTFETVRIQAFSAMGISLLAALFIIFTTLSMGVDERIRQFAMLRAISLTKSQIGAMVFLEGVLLGLIGWAGGLLAGLGLLRLMAGLRPESVVEGASLGKWSILLSGACALGGSLAASILPVWRATRVSPLEAMAQKARPRSSRAVWLATAIGLPLIAVNPLVVFFMPMQDKLRYGISAAIGCTAMAIGFVLLAPMAVVVTEKLLGPIAARLLGLHPRLLASQLSSNMGRTLGTTISLTIGLGLFVAMQTWGYSMLAPFTPGDWAPDLVVSIAPGGVPDKEIDAIRRVRGIDPKHFAPLAVKHVKFSGDPTGFKERLSATRQDSCVMIGIDPEAALGGDDPLFHFEFVDGTREEAIAKLKRGRYSVVPDHFCRESGLGIGDKFAVIAPGSPDEPIEYEIAGVVSMPGWHWLTKSGFRRGRAAGLMFSPFDQVRRDFETGRTSMFWADMDGTATEDEIKAAIQPIAARSLDPKLAGAGRGNAPGPRRGPAGANVTIRSAEGARAEVRERADGIIWALSELPLVTLAVASIGVINTVLSSIRSRRWDLGVLRALGVTRSGLARLIVAEALLVGVVACVLSLGFGAMAGYCGTGVTRYVNIRGGQYTPLVLPWARLSVGFAITLGLCLIAALLPAISTGRTEPLRLLQAGRAAT